MIDWLIDWLIDIIIIIFQKFGLLIPAVRVALMASGIVYLELLPVVLGFFALVAFVTSWVVLLFIITIITFDNNDNSIYQDINTNEIPGKFLCAQK